MDLTDGMANAYMANAYNRAKRIHFVKTQQEQPQDEQRS